MGAALLAYLWAGLGVFLAIFAWRVVGLAMGRLERLVPAFEPGDLPARIAPTRTNGVLITLGACLLLWPLIVVMWRRKEPR